MKIRSGFVSNSSSSSFVFIGAVIPRGTITKRRFADLMWPGNTFDEDDVFDKVCDCGMFFESSEDGCPDGMSMIGKMITISDQGYNELNENLTKFLDVVNHIVKTVGLENEDLRIISGTQMG